MEENELLDIKEDTTCLSVSIVTMPQIIARNEVENDGVGSRMIRSTIGALDDYPEKNRGYRRDLPGRAGK